MGDGSTNVTGHPVAGALDLEGVGHAYGSRRALDGITFSVPFGGVTMLLGPNGAGKTTLFSLVTRLFDVREGRIAIAGRDLRATGAAALAPLGVVFQQPTLDLDLTVMENLAYYAALRGLDRRAARARARTMLDRLAMADRGHERVRVLNGGHRRRVEIARALLHGPRLLLLDEPTVGLDPPTRADLVATVHALARDDGVGVLWATHLVDEVARDDRVVVLDRGRIAARGTAAEIIGRHGGEAASLSAAFSALTRGASQTGRGGAA